MISNAENLRKEAGIAGFTVDEQDQPMALGKTLGCIFQQVADERLITPTSSPCTRAS
jgi:hypothetical protein